MQAHDERREATRQLRLLAPLEPPPEKLEERGGAGKRKRQHGALEVRGFDVLQRAQRVALR